MFSNIATAATSSTAITFALFYIMQLLVTLQPGAEVEARDRDQLIWVRVPRPVEPLQTMRNVKPKEIDPPPEVPQSTRDPEVDTYTPGVPARPPAPPPEGMPGPGSFMPDGPLVAMVRVEPGYPAAAEQKGLEGYVLVEFDVTPEGAVTNVRVIESSHRVFEGPARKAAQRFRFKPRVVDGIPQATSGIRNLFRFEMEE